MSKKRRRPLLHRPTCIVACCSASPSERKLNTAQEQVTIDESRTPSLLTTTTSGTSRPLRSRNRKNTRKVIHRYHWLRKQLEKHCSDAPDSQKRAWEQELEEIGGLDAYQKASLLGQSRERGGDTSKWLVPHLQRFREDAKSTANYTSTSTRRLRLLDVGALRNNYAEHHRWLDVTCIDLNAQSLEIVQMDLLEVPAEREPERWCQFDVVCLSLVLNFPPSPAVRGAMLQKACSCLRADGERLLFVVLPLACVENSRYLTSVHFVEMMAEVFGMECVAQHFSLKLAHFLFRSQPAMPGSASPAAAALLRYARKTELNPGSRRNNFAILFEQE